MTNKPTPRKPWTDADNQYLRDHYPHEHTQAVADAIGRTMRAVYHQANSLALYKTDEYLNGPYREAQRGLGAGTATRFPQGNVPWNKGTKGLAAEYCSSRFRPGQIPVNTRPLGSYRFSPDGLLQQKVTTLSGCNSKRWRGVHELIWIAANGPVPPHHIVVFRQGQRTNKADEITLDRVECISRAEHARRNHPRSHSPELAALVQLKGAITRQVNRIAKQTTQPKQQHPEGAPAP